MIFRLLVAICVFAAMSFAQMPAVEPGVSHELAKWRAARYSEVRYKLNLTLEKMSPVLKGTIEIRLKVGEKGSGGDKETVAAASASVPPAVTGGATWPKSISTPIILDWRKIVGHEKASTLSNIYLNEKLAVPLPDGISDLETPKFVEGGDHLAFYGGVLLGENIIKLDFTSPILTSGSAITRYVDKEDGAEYIYSLFVPSDASTAFPMFDQPDLKARFKVEVTAPSEWAVVSNTNPILVLGSRFFAETKPISTYVFAFAAGPFERVSEPPALAGGTNAVANSTSGPIVQRPTKTTPTPPAYADGSDRTPTSIYVRKSQAAKFKPHAVEVFRLNREGIKFLESYFDYKFPFPKYDLVLIPEFPFGGMEHAGATFLRESSIIFPQEPTKNDYISRATLIFHEAAHQWFGDTVTMKWFDDLWLKEGFAEFMAYKTLEKVMPEYNAWKVFYERNKQAAYLTDSTKGTTPIYQEIANLSSAKSAYGNIVYRKAPSFLKQAEFYIGPDKFQTAVRTFLKRYEFGNAGWEDLVKEFETASGRKDLDVWARRWVLQRGVPLIRLSRYKLNGYCLKQSAISGHEASWPMKVNVLQRGLFGGDMGQVEEEILDPDNGSEKPIQTQVAIATVCTDSSHGFEPKLVFPNYRDYGYGIFLLDDQSRDYVLKNIGSEKDDFLRTMMWGSLWDSVREGELDPKEYVELVVKNLKIETDESTIQTLLGRVSTAIRYYIDAEPPMRKPAREQGLNTKRAGQALPNGRASATDLQTRVENLLIDRMQNAATPGQRITYYRSFLNIASSENARRIMKEILEGASKAEVPPMQKPAREQGPSTQRPSKALPNGRASAKSVTTKDKFDIVARLIILGDAEASKLLADLEKTETSDEAKRYAYAAKAGFATAENKAKFWNDFVANKDISESWIEAAFGPFNNVRHNELTLSYLEKALAELPNLKRNRKIFFVNGWLGAFIGGQKSEQALAIVNKFLADNPSLDRDLRLKILENVDVIERAVKIRGKY